MKVVNITNNTTHRTDRQNTPKREKGWESNVATIDFLVIIYFLLLSLLGLCTDNFLSGKPAGRL